MGVRAARASKGAGGTRRDTLSSHLALQASVVKGREVLQIGSPSESLHRFPTKETAKMSLISPRFLSPTVPLQRIRNFSFSFVGVRFYLLLQRNINYSNTYTPL